MANDPPTFAVPPGFLGIGRREHDAAISIAGIPLDIGTTNRSGAWTRLLRTKKKSPATSYPQQEFIPK